MREASRADHQHTVPAQSRKCLPDPEMMRRPQMTLQRHLQHRDIRGRPRQKQRHPGAMIKPAVSVHAAWQPGRGKQIADPFGQDGITRRRITQIEQRPRKPMKVVDRLIHRHRVDGRSLRLPMRRGNQDRARTLPSRLDHRAKPKQKIPRRCRRQCQHRRPMADEQTWQHHRLSHFTTQTSLAAPNAQARPASLTGHCPMSPAPGAPGIPHP